MFARAAKDNEHVTGAIDKVVFLSVDCEKGEGPEVAKKYDVRGFPTFLVVDDEGTVTDGWIGYPGPEKWAAFVAAGLADRRPIPAKQAAYDEAPTLELALSLANYAAVGYDFKGSVEYLGQARELDPEREGMYTTDILTYMYYGSRDTLFTMDQVEAEADRALAAPAGDLEGLLDVAMMVTMMAKQADQAERAAPYLEQAMAASKDTQDEDLAHTRLLLSIDHALLSQKDTDLALKLKRQSMDEGWQENTRALNSFAWWCFENGVNLDEAEALAVKGAELAADDGERANLLDTAAEICAARGDCDRAVEKIRRAVELAPERQYFKDQLTRFEQKVKNGDC